MKDIFNGYKFIRWIKIKHPINYEFLEIDFEDEIKSSPVPLIHRQYLFLVWLEQKWDFLFYDYFQEFSDDENFDIILKWEKEY